MTCYSFTQCIMLQNKNVCGEILGKCQHGLPLTAALLPSIVFLLTPHPTGLILFYVELPLCKRNN